MIMVPSSTRPLSKALIRSKRRDQISLWDQVMDASDQDVLVMRSVEDGNFTQGRCGTMDPPQEIVRTLQGGRLLEPHHFAALWIHRTQDVFDRPVLAACVQRLQANQDRSPSVGVEQLLQFSQPLLGVLDLLGRILVAFVTVFETRVDVFKIDGGAGSYSEAFHILHFVPPRENDFLLKVPVGSRPERFVERISLSYAPTVASSSPWTVA